MPFFVKPTEHILDWTEITIQYLMSMQYWVAAS